MAESGSKQKSSFELCVSLLELKGLRVLLLAKGKLDLFGSKIHKSSLPQCVLQNLQMWTLRRLFKHPAQDDREFE